MKYLLLIIIQIYWFVIPKSKRRKCLFKISCSNYVYEISKQKGVIAGLKALKFRMKNCNPKYSIIYINGEKVLISSTLMIIKGDDLNPTILK